MVWCNVWHNTNFTDSRSARVYPHQSSILGEGLIEMNGASIGVIVVIIDTECDVIYFLCFRFYNQMRRARLSVSTSCVASAFFRDDAD
jgi:hypothetical protein